MERSPVDFFQTFRIQSLAIALITAAPLVAADTPCDERFFSALDLCEAASCRFPHPLTGESMEQQVLGRSGQSDDSCLYQQQMPGAGRMECRFPQAELAAMAAFFRATAEAETIGASARTQLGTGETVTEQRIDGQVTANPLAEALTRGLCQIRGYGS